jgi:hypothetical protein
MSDNTIQHNRPKALNEAKREMNRSMKNLGKRLGKKFNSFPGGEFVLMTRCLVQDDRTGVTSQHYSVVGEGTLLDAVKKYGNEITQHMPANEEEEMVIDGNESDQRTNDAESYLVMPSSAIPRATKLRNMLRMLWKMEGHSNTKQIYNAVANGEAGFSWWDTEFPDIDFNNTAVAASENSARIYHVVAPKIYEQLTGHRPATNDDAPVVPFVRCDRYHYSTGLQECSMKKNHPGKCNMSYVPPIVRIEDEQPIVEQQQQQQGEATDPADFFRYAKHVCHKKEPFFEFTAGQLKEFAVHMKNYKNRMKSYIVMGITIPRKYGAWYTKDGIRTWQEIEEKFPDYLEDDVLFPPLSESSLPPPPPPRQRKINPNKKKKKKKKNIKTDRIIQFKNTRQQKAYENQRKRMDMYV